VDVQKLFVLIERVSRKLKIKRFRHELILFLLGFKRINDVIVNELQRVVWKLNLTTVKRNPYTDEFFLRRKLDSFLQF